MPTVLLSDLSRNKVTTLSRYLAGKYRTLEAYTAGEQPQDKKYIKLNTNESPYSPSEGVVKAVREYDTEKLKLYCDPEAKALREKLAYTYGVGSENVFVSNGSDDILNFCFALFTQNGAAYADITYGFYKVFAKLHGAKSQIIHLEGDFRLTPKNYYGLNKLIMIANPNAPTGLSISLDDIENIVCANPDSVVVIDEAYVDFGGESAVKLTKKYDNLLVVMTYSKSRSLAGARLGFAIGNKQLIDDLNLMKNSTNPYNVNALTQSIGLAALGDAEYYTSNCEKIIKTREYTKAALLDLGFDVTDSKANFLFAKSDKIGGKKLYLFLKSKGFLVRHFNTPRTSEYIRISIGTQENMEALIKAIK